MYFSTSRGSYESSRVEAFFADPFEEFLSLELGRRPHIFFDTRQLSVGSKWRHKINNVLENSQIMPIFMTGRTSRSDWSLEDIYQFRSVGPRRRIVPVILGGDLSQMPEEFRELNFYDFREHFVTLSASKYLSSAAGSDMFKKVADVAKGVAMILAR